MPALKRFITAAVLVGLVGVVDIAAPTTAQAVTVVNVDTTNDIVDGNPATTSLREAIDSANGDSQATEIVLGVGMTYQLTLCGPNDDTNAAGDLDHTEGAQVTIFGNGSTIEQTCAGERVLQHFEPTASVVIVDATITGGNVTGFAMDSVGDSVGGGGGVLSHGRGIFNDVVVTGNSAEDLGAGVRVIKAASFNGSTIDANTGGGGGAAVGRTNDPGFTSSLLAVTNSSFDSNGGVGLSVFSGSGTIDASTMSSNTDDGFVPKFGIIAISNSAINDNTGFGINSLDGPLTLTDSEVNSNGGDGLKTTGAGSLDLTDVDVLDNGGNGLTYLACDGQGLTDVITAVGSTITGNVGAGAFSSGCGGIVVENSTVSDNASGIVCTECSSIRVEFSTIANNTSGGGIQFAPDDDFLPTASLLVRASTIADNVAAGDGGGINVEADGSFPVTVTVSESTTITGNIATDGDGGGIAVDGADFFFTSSFVNDNTAGDPDDQLNGPFGRGGGVFVRNGSLSAAQVGVSGNRANGNGGAIAHVGFNGDLANIFSLIADDNEANGTGGAVDIDSPDGLTISDSTITNNQSTAQGGGIAIRNTPSTIERSTIASNTSGAVGGGIYSFESQNPGFGLLVDASAVTGNSGPGGAIFGNTNAPTEVRNSTVSGNNSIGLAAGINTNLELRFATIVDNAGGNVTTPNGNMSATASVVADPDGGANCSIGGFTLSSGSNADTDGTCGFSNINDLAGLGSVGLGALGANGGSTETHAVLSGSPLRDAVVPVLCAGVLSDQRGTVRPQGAACEVGAYEAVAMMFTSLTWEAVARLGRIDFPVTELVDFGDFTPDPATLRVLQAPDVGDVTVESGLLRFTYSVPDGQVGSPVVTGEFQVLFELCAAEDPGACSEGTVVLSLADPATACTIEGTERGDVLWGTSGDDIICARGGNDIVFGRGGNDIILSGAGRDLVLAGSGDDIVTGDDGNDVLLGQRGSDWLDGGDGRRDLCLARGGAVVNCEFPHARSHMSRH